MTKETNINMGAKGTKRAGYIHSERRRNKIN
jgi:hypothetical protein